MKINIQSVKLPEFGVPKESPELPALIYEQRLAQLRGRMKQDQIDFCMIYADREHTANLTWLCGYDPRFEESILIIGQTLTPTILVGNEGWGYCDLAGLPMKKVLRLLEVHLDLDL